ncbi:protein cordon-bleu isoform X10 [Nycticebus coucang]|uniref:protein cordon-bleu isoform X10 n=1 Tax=Nycticebus coucang TaxID=9470 RepID=UPI00234E0185|nr:protein cordon-bleu isoform X10 [Nycticebus coucang]
MDAPRASAARPPTGRRMKARAPPPPGKPASNTDSEQKLPRDVALSPQQNLVHMKEALRDSTVDVTVVLPSGLEKRSVLNGSHAMMDLLVDLCLQNHLNPSHHALEIRSSETQQPLSFKPNTLVGTLNVHTVLLKEKVPEEKVKPGPPKMPEKSVRLVVNYLRTQKAVVRVSPEVPLQNILPVICAKCEVTPEHVVLLRDNIAGEELELSKSLSELGIKELYAWDNRRETFRKSSLGNDETDKEKKKFLGFFKVNRRSTSKGCLTTPNSPSLHSCSLMLGPSLSLGSISGASVKSEMKKRRAPPPPSSGPPAQAKASEKVCLGSQVDLQKKKRRAPAPPSPQPLSPQPPPPSPLVPSRLEDKEEHRKSAVVSLPLGPSSHGSPDGAPKVLSEAEETVSVSSCFASEDTTEDSGVMSSPSDIVSLDSQHDSVKSKDKWATDQEDCSDQDLVGTPELDPQKSPCWERNGCENLHLRTEKAASASKDDEDLFTGQFHETLAELDGDLEEMEESYETDTSSLTSSMPGMSSLCTQDAVSPQSNADTIPVTFIGEVSDDPEDLGSFSNKNNNAGSSDTEDAVGRRAHLVPPQAGPNQHHGTREDAAAHCPPSRNVGRGAHLGSSNTCMDRNSLETGPKVTAFASDAHREDLADTKGRDAWRGCPSREKAQAVQKASTLSTNEKGDRDKGAVSATPSWCQRGQNPAGSYGLKYGLTTYKIVPPKSEMRHYDRGVSLSTGAIEIDELGNLVSTPASRTITLLSTHLEAETQPIETVKEFWRRSSMEKPLAHGPPTTPAPSRIQQVESEPHADPTPASTPHLSAHQESGSHREEGSSWPPTAVASHSKVPAAHATEVSFLKPHRRTSSQYVASAIAKRIGPLKAHPNMVGCDHDQKGYVGRMPMPTGQPLGGKGSMASSLRSETQGRNGGAQQPCATLPNSPGEVPAVGAHPRGEASGPCGKLSAQDCPAGIHKSSNFPPFTSSQRCHVSVGQSCGFSGKQSTENQETGSVCDPKCPLDRTDPHPAHSADTRAPGRVLVNGSAWAPGSSKPPRSPEESGTNSRIILEKEEKPSLFSADEREADSTLSSIFGPKKKFRPVVQRPVPKDTSLHTSLMEAIHSAGGKDRLRKTAEHALEGRPKKPSYTESESERSALLAAIRGHSGACSLRKVSSFTSEELRSFRNATLSAQSMENPPQNDLGLVPPPAVPPSPPPASQALSTSRTASRFNMGTLGNPVDARQALMDAIRSGTGAARLRKTPLLV